LNTNPPNRLVSEILIIEVADKQTDRQTHTPIHTSTDFKGRLKLAAHEPIDHGTVVLIPIGDV